MPDSEDAESFRPCVSDIPMSLYDIERAFTNTDNRRILEHLNNLNHELDRTRIYVAKSFADTAASNCSLKVVCTQAEDLKTTYDTEGLSAAFIRKLGSLICSMSLLNLQASRDSLRFVHDTEFQNKSHAARGDSQEDPWDSDQEEPSRIGPYGANVINLLGAANEEVLSLAFTSTQGADLGEIYNHFRVRKSGMALTAEEIRVAANRLQTSQSAPGVWGSVQRPSLHQQLKYLSDIPRDEGAFQLVNITDTHGYTMLEDWVTRGLIANYGYKPAGSLKDMMTQGDLLTGP